MDNIVFIPVALIILVLIFVSLWKEYRGKESQPQGENNTNSLNSLLLLEEATSQIKLKEPEKKGSEMNNQKGTRDLLMETLTKIGCQYEIADEDSDDRIIFAYQGEHFFVGAEDDAKIIHIYDPNWGMVELYDIDELARLKKVINQANMDCFITTFYVINEAGSRVDVCCKASILFIPEIPQIEEYLRGVLANFFYVHRFISTELAKRRDKEGAIKS